MSDWKVTYDYITNTDSLNRQRMLAMTGTVLAGSVAGCSGGADEETAAGDTDGSGDDDSDDGSGATDASETEESGPDVVVVEEEMTNDTEYAKVVEFEVDTEIDYLTTKAIFYPEQRRPDAREFHRLHDESVLLRRRRQRGDFDKNPAHGAYVNKEIPPGETVQVAYDRGPADDSDAHPDDVASYEFTLDCSEAFEEGVYCP